MRTTEENVETMVALARILNKHAIPHHRLATLAGLHPTTFHYALPNGGCQRKLGVHEYKAILDAVSEEWPAAWSELAHLILPGKLIPVAPNDQSDLSTRLDDIQNYLGVGEEIVKAEMDGVITIDEARAIRSRAEQAHGALMAQLEHDVREAAK